MSIESIGIVGVSARRSGAEVLSHFTLSREDQERRLPEIAQRLEAREMVYLATCNRAEVIFRCAPGRPVEQYRHRVFRELAGREPAPGEAERTCRAWVGEGAVEHLFLVATGLDSAQVGEREIRAQVREALKLARSTGTSGPLLNHLFDESLRVAGEVHQQVRMPGRRTSLADVAAEHLLERVRRTPGRVALFGVTPMTRRCGRALAREEVPLVVVNRTPERAAELAAELGAQSHRSLDEFREYPERVEALLLSTGSPEPVLDRTHLERITARTPSGEAPLIVDMAVPPDVDPADARAVGAERLGMDEINTEASANRRERLVELAPAREIVDAALENLRHRLAERTMAPVIARLNQRYRETALEGLERLFRKELRGVDEETRRAIRQWAEVLARRFAHVPTMGLRGLASEVGAPAVRAFLAATGEEGFADALDVADRLEEFSEATEREEER
jgi:glutamyl-tRNA reductase